MNTEEQDRLRRKAEQIVYETDLTDRQCIILAMDLLGHSENEMCNFIGRSIGTVRETQAELRSIHRETEDQIEKLETQRELIGESSIVGIEVGNDRR